MAINSTKNSDFFCFVLHGPEHDQHARFWVWLFFGRLCGVEEADAPFQET